MAFRIGVDVEKGEVVIILGYLVRRDLALDDLGENTAHSKGVWVG